MQRKAGWPLGVRRCPDKGGTVRRGARPGEERRPAHWVFGESGRAPILDGAAG